MDGTADLGGTAGWGPVRAPDPAEPVFHEPWEGRAFALTVLTMGRISGRNIDAFRHALDRLDRAAYLDHGYYGRWLAAAELMLIDSAILAPGAVEARARRLQGADVAEPPAPEPDVPTMPRGGAGNLRSVDEPPVFAVGDTVTTRAGEPAPHTRLPAYARGRTGTVVALCPAQVFPDTAAQFTGESPQHVYEVRFESHELWGEDAEPASVTIDLYESYLEKAR
jgi:nitrile hydratase beta subunit